MPKSSLKPVVLLLSESQQSHRSIAKLLDPNFTVIVVDDAESAWERLVDNAEILVLIGELRLVIDDFDLMERVRNANDHRLAASPVLLLVGETDNEDDRETAFRAGATDFINMPFISSELITRVRLHAQLFAQHVQGPAIVAESVAAANVLQQLAHEKMFLSRLEQELSFSHRHKTFFSACLLRIDNLKAILAGFDKNTAIAVVQAVARILQLSVRSEDTLCYLGNAEFCILFPATNGIGVAICVNRVQKRVSESKIRAGGKQVPVSLSGAIFTDIADADTDTETVRSVLQKRLREAIAKGGNCIVSSPQASEKNQLSIDRALRLIAQNDTDSLESVAQELMQNILPLLEYSDRVLKLGLKLVNQSLRDKLK